MALLVRIWLAVFVLSATTAPVADSDAVSLLSRQVSHFSIGKTSALDAPLWLGRDERVCFGVEFYGTDLSREVQVEADRTTLSEAVKTLLHSADAYQLSVSDGVILIRKKGGKPPDWLNHRVPKFKVPRGELMGVEFQLWGALEADLNPKQASGGDYPPTDPIDEVGPFNVCDQTVRQLLIRIVSESRGASWFLTQRNQISFPAAKNPFWTLVTVGGRSSPRPQ
jgi:hypothetical protein